MTDLVDRLKKPYWEIPYNGGPLRHEAAAEIERLRRVTHVMLEALQESRRVLVSGGFINAAWLTPMEGSTMSEDRDIIEKLKETLKQSPDSGATAEQWDRWFDVSALDRDLRRKLSFHDLRRLGAHAIRAFAFRESVLTGDKAADRLEAALRDLANAADNVGVRHFDTDTMSPEVEAMQAATLRARAAITKAERGAQ